MLSLVIVVVIIFLISQLDTQKCKKVKCLPQGYVGNQLCSQIRTGELRAEATLSTKDGAVALSSTKN